MENIDKTNDMLDELEVSLDGICDEYGRAEKRRNAIAELLEEKNLKYFFLDYPCGSGGRARYVKKDYVNGFAIYQYAYGKGAFNTAECVKIFFDGDTHVGDSTWKNAMSKIK